MATMATRPRLIVGISGAMGGIIMPPVPAFYLNPSDIDELVGHTAGRALALAGIDVPGLPHWGESER